MKCKVCGTENTDNSKFCKECGANLTEMCNNKDIENLNNNDNKNQNGDSNNHLGNFFNRKNKSSNINNNNVNKEIEGNGNNSLVNKKLIITVVIVFAVAALIGGYFFIKPSYASLYGKKDYNGIVELYNNGTLPGNDNEYLMVATSYVSIGEDPDESLREFFKTYSPLLEGDEETLEL